MRTCVYSTREMMASMHRCLALFVIFTINISTCHESEHYLQNAVRDLRKLKSRQTLRRADTAMVSAAANPVISEDVPVQPQVERRVRQGDEVPPISLTKGELAALYESAVSKGETLKLDTGDETYIHAAVHELDSSENRDTQNYDTKNPADTSGTDASGYYYYYYPIKSFIDEMSSQPSSSSNEYAYKPSKPIEIHTTQKPQYQYHSHHHQHNITITKAMMEDKKSKNLEPLFMAISGFIGMAVMFVLSVLVLPKFGIKPKTRGTSVKKNEKIEDFARLAMNAIDSGDCAERFACELSKTARAFNLQDNRFVKLLKRLAPGTFGKHIDRVGKYSNKQLKCTAIPCKKKSANNNQKKKNAQKKH